ncbi:Uncharacterized protein dnm_085190 [Desulfonema magnum]|uniref:Uncharacterized protein n=1 Tax=Desulfonema magnum TaxID=45655 RepID=A0A975BWD8_9BACT|nr:Uncharacterized protein dnm_085190 [Desulfonema magnum]
MIRSSDPVRTKSLSFLGKQESVFGRWGVPGAVKSCFYRLQQAQTSASSVGSSNGMTEKLDHRAYK